MNETQWIEQAQKRMDDMHKNDKPLTAELVARMADATCDLWNMYTFHSAQFGWTVVAIRPDGTRVGKHYKRGDVENPEQLWAEKVRSRMSWAELHDLRKLAVGC